MAAERAGRLLSDSWIEGLRYQDGSTGTESKWLRGRAAGGRRSAEGSREAARHGWRRRGRESEEWPSTCWTLIDTTSQHLNQLYTLVHTSLSIYILVYINVCPWNSTQMQHLFGCCYHLGKYSFTIQDETDIWKQGAFHRVSTYGSGAARLLPK